MAKEVGEKWAQGRHTLMGNRGKRYQHSVSGAPLSLTPPSPLGRYSAVRDLLADLEQETRTALKNLYGFPENKSRKRREAESWTSAWEGTRPKFLKLVPLLAFSQDETSKARDFLTGRKRKVSGSIIHKASDVMHVHESKEVVGFQLVRCMSSQLGAMGWARDGGSTKVSPLPLSLRSRSKKYTQLRVKILQATKTDSGNIKQKKKKVLERNQKIMEACQRTEIREGPGI